MNLLSLPRPTLLFDFAEVISLPQDMEVFGDMASVLELDPKNFRESYWRHRRPYDLGQEGRVYWSQVAERELGSDVVGKLIELDCRSWFRINPATLKLISALRSRGLRLALLSNLPIDLVQNLRETGSFLESFDHVFFSAELKLAKPDLEIYQHVLRVMKVSGPEILFFDDRQENLDGAKELGIHTHLFRPGSPGDLLAQL